ncbi:MAG: hypothetical protein ABSG35_22830 [Syntrophobacteraceae bacterium]|jgi:hypothetical protein
MALNLESAWHEAREANFAGSRDDLIDYGGVITLPRYGEINEE